MTTSAVKRWLTRRITLNLPPLSRFFNLLLFSSLFRLFLTSIENVSESRLSSSSSDDQGAHVFSCEYPIDVVLDVVPATLACLDFHASVLRRERLAIKLSRWMSRFQSSKLSSIVVPSTCAAVAGVRRPIESAYTTALSKSRITNGSKYLKLLSIRSTIASIHVSEREHMSTLCART